MRQTEFDLYILYLYVEHGFPDFRTMSNVCKKKMKRIEVAHA